MSVNQQIDSIARNQILGNKEDIIVVMNQKHLMTHFRIGERQHTRKD